MVIGLISECFVTSLRYGQVITQTLWKELVFRQATAMDIHRVHGARMFLQFQIIRHSEGHRLRHRKTLQYGQLYRGRSFTGKTKYSENDGNITEWTVVSKDKKTALGVIIQKLATPNNSYQYFRARGLEPDRLYHIFNREIKVNIEDFGDLINTVSPIHIKNDSALQRALSRFYKLGGDVEDMEMFGDAIMNAGIKLLPAYAATGFNEKTRLFSDFASRLYIIEESE